MRVRDWGSPRAWQSTREREEVSWEPAILQCIDGYLWVAGKQREVRESRSHHALGAGRARERGERRGNALQCKWYCAMMGCRGL